MKESIFNQDGSLKTSEDIIQDKFFEVLDRNPHLVDQLAKNVEESIENKVSDCPYCVNKGYSNTRASRN